MPEADVVIVGGGPGGTTAALCLRQQMPSARIMVLDSSSFPRDKACGDAVGPTAVRVYRSLGLEGTLFSKSLRVSRGRLIGPGGIEFVAAFDAETDELPPYGYIQTRTEFDSSLIAVCKTRDVDVREKTEVIEVVRREECWAIRCESDRGTEEVLSPVVVAADGATSLVRRTLQIASLKKRSRAVAIRAYADWSSGGRRLEQGELLVAYEPALAPIYGWVFPLADGSVNMGVGFLEVDKNKGDRNLSRQLQVFAHYLSDRGFALTNLRENRSHSLPLGNNRLPIAREGVFLMGDAAGMINPLSGEGISYIARASEILAAELASVSRADWTRSRLDGVGRRYERRFRAEYSAHYRSNYWATRALSRRRIGSIIFRAAERSEPVRTYGVSLMFGDARFNARAVWIIGRGLLSRGRG